MTCDTQATYLPNLCGSVCSPYLPPLLLTPQPPAPLLCLLPTILPSPPTLNRNRNRNHNRNRNRSQRQHHGGSFGCALIGMRCSCRGRCMTCSALAPPCAPLVARAFSRCFLALCLFPTCWLTALCLFPTCWLTSDPGRQLAESSLQVRAAACCMSSLWLA